MQAITSLEAAIDAANAPLPPRGRADLRPYPNEKKLFSVMAVVSVLCWVMLTVVTVGTVWIFMLSLYLLGLVAFSYFIAYVRGNGVRVTPEQFPDLHQRFETCCNTVGLPKRPEFYLLTGNGALNAFATRFLRRYYVVLYSDIVDALEEDPEALNFYMGHELGHISQKHLAHHWWLVFARWMPWLGAAYSRAREYTCDQYGLLCTHNRQSAVRALAVLAAGSRRWQTMNTRAYVAQAGDTGGFWMSLNELTADYPWLCKRVARIEQGENATFPRRSFWAWLMALLVPNTGFGLLGAVVLYAYFLILLVPMGFSAYHGYTARAKAAALAVEHQATREQLSRAHDAASAAAQAVVGFYEKKHELPDSLKDTGFRNPDEKLIKQIDFDSDAQEIAVRLNPPLDRKTLTLSLGVDDKRRIVWTCLVGGQVASAAELPEDCAAKDIKDAEETAPATPGWVTKLLELLL